MKETNKRGHRKLIKIFQHLRIGSGMSGSAVYISSVSQ